MGSQYVATVTSSRQLVGFIAWISAVGRPIILYQMIVSCLPISGRWSTCSSRTLARSFSPLDLDRTNKMPSFRICVYPGDGIGPEVAEQAVRVLQAVQPLEPGLDWEFTSVDWGVELWRRIGMPVPDDFLEFLRPFDAILLGAVGWPADMPDHLSLAPLVQIRQAFDQYACVRPAKLYAGVRSYLADKGPEHIGLV